MQDNKDITVAFFGSPIKEYQAEYPGNWLIIQPFFIRALCRHVGDLFATATGKWIFLTRMSVDTNYMLGELVRSHQSVFPEKIIELHLMVPSQVTVDRMKLIPSFIWNHADTRSFGNISDTVERASCLLTCFTHPTTEPSLLYARGSGTPVYNLSVGDVLTSAVLDQGRMKAGISEPLM